jgi:putative SOS response-associated peptidase YedK
VAPSNDVYVVVDSGGIGRLDTFHWGLIPFWAKDVKTGNKMINARAETLATKNAFKSPLAKRRCIIPADGFYEWMKVPGQKNKQPMFIHRGRGPSPSRTGRSGVINASPTSEAGGGPPLLHDHHRGAEREGPPGPRRMPVIRPGHPETWLAPSRTSRYDQAPVARPRRSSTSTQSAPR